MSAQEPRLVHAVINIFSAWVVPTDDGYLLNRGIPQGSSVGSFFGNIFLLKLDQEMAEFEEKHTTRARYFRYMDDIRLFTKERSVAREGALLIEKVLRRMHLNLQSSKTKIFDEEANEISAELIDTRIDDLKALEKGLSGPITLQKKIALKATLREIGARDVKNKQKIRAARKPLKGLSLRAFRMWINAHIRIHDYSVVDRLCLEVSRNPEHRLTRRLVSICRRNPALNA